LCAIVTGSASGLGAATAANLAKGGARIVVNYSTAKRKPKRRPTSAASAGAEVVVVQGDVSRDEDCRRSRRLLRHGAVSTCSSTIAGTTKHVPHQDLDGLTAEDFQRIYAVNHDRPVPDDRAAARAQLEAGAKASGRPSAVVNVSSVAGIPAAARRSPMPQARARSTPSRNRWRARWRLDPRQHGLSRLYRYALFTKGRGEAGAKAVRDAVVAKVPLKVASTAEDIAQLVCFLASPASSNMTGEFVRMDAGMHLVL